jgi:two-component system sensor histidine kinase RegB
MDSIIQTKLHWIHRLRWFAVLSQIVVLPFAIRFGYLSKDNILPYILIVLVTIIFNIKRCWNKLSLYKNITFQTIFDLLIFTLLILISSKMENPFWPLIYLHGGMSAFLIEQKKDYQFLPFLFGSIAIVHALSIQYYSSIVFILIPQWLILIAIWFLTRRIASLLMNQHKLIVDLNQKEYKRSKLKSIGLLSSGILHEVGTPLNTIRLKTNRLINKGVENFSARDIEVLDQSLLSIEGVVNQLNQAQYESEQNLTQTVDIYSYLNDLNNNWEKEFQGLSINIKTDTKTKLISISKVNFSIIMKVIINNAIEAGAETLNFSILIDENVIIKIKDNGPGFPSLILENFKAPYTSTKGKGRGIGLFNANLSLESMGGSMSIYNENGATIEIELGLNDEN